MRHVQLRAFHFVATEGGFSRAARALGLTQPAISDQVRALEQAHDVLLFDRSKKQIRLTPQGEQLLRITRAMFEHEARAAAFLAESRAVVAGHLRIIADSAQHVAGLLGRFRTRHPKVRITLRSGNSREVEAALAAYRAEIGVLGGSLRAARFESLLLGASPIVAFAARDLPGRPHGPATLQELARLPLVLREPGSVTRSKLEEQAREAGMELSPAIEAEGREAVREIVAAGGGIGFVSRAEYGHDPRLVMIPLAGTPPTMEETVLCLSQRKELRLIRAFMALARQYAQTVPRDAPPGS